MAFKTSLITSATLAVALLGAGSCFAAGPAAAWNGVGVGEGEVLSGPTTIVPTRTRAELRNEVIAARGADALPGAGEGLAVVAKVAAPQAGRDRAEVKAETVAARRAGQLLGAGEAIQTVQTAARADRALTVGSLQR